MESWEKTPTYEELLERLTGEYHISLETLAGLFQIDARLLQNLEVCGDLVPVKQRMEITNMMHVLYFMSEFSIFERNRAVLDVLFQIHKLLPSTVAHLAKVSEDDIALFMKDESAVPDDVKYRIASTALFLHFLFKPRED
ncbi:HTH domain-containing protein [Anaerolentibacter hominis]|uniref:HTH domain-containing protein n=1 Tax=Anaerolentibacter hominis TaxID=3079009 RepID=UPI0031B852E3